MPYGYPLEQHFAVTSDGYILRLFRIPSRRQTSAARAHGLLRRPRPEAASYLWPAAAAQVPVPQPAVLLQHGLLGSASDFVLNGPGLSLPLMLADAGYDVWLGNVGALGLGNVGAVGLGRHGERGTW